MVGNDSARFCNACEKTVYNVSSMSRAEAEGLLSANATGEICVRFFERADGTILTADCPVGVQRKERRKLALAVFGGGAMWSMNVLAAAGSFGRAAATPTPPQPCMLESVSMPGYVVIQGEVGTRVTIDGELTTTLPSATVALNPGSHLVKLTRVGDGRTESRIIGVQSNQTTLVEQLPRLIVAMPVQQPVAQMPVSPPPEGRWLAGGIRRQLPLPSKLPATRD